jgi:methylmalonyl-CoA mutase
MQKHTGELPIIGVNTYLAKDGSPTILPKEVIRADPSEKENQLITLHTLHTKNMDDAKKALKNLQLTALSGKNIFHELMEATKCCSLGQVTNALYEVGGQYRRNM